MGNYTKEEIEKQIVELINEINLESDSLKKLVAYHELDKLYVLLGRITYETVLKR